MQAIAIANWKGDDMSTKYKAADEVPTEIICARLNELSNILSHRKDCDWKAELTMRVPAELDRDADLVLSIAAQRLTAKDERIAELEARLKRYDTTPVRLSFWGMNDNHTFVKFEPSSIDDLITQWQRTNSEQFGAPALCPVTLIAANGAEVRIVGKMVHCVSDIDGTAKYRAALESDPDVMRILTQ